MHLQKYEKTFANLIVRERSMKSIQKSSYNILVIKRFFHTLFSKCILK